MNNIKCKMSLLEEETASLPSNIFRVESSIQPSQYNVLIRKEDEQIYENLYKENIFILISTFYTVVVYIQIQVGRILGRWSFLLLWKRNTV